MKGSADNLSNAYAVSKWMSTKYPLTILIMELSETLRTRDCELNLQWVPRDLNQLADDLTNQKFDSFPSDKRIQFVGGDTKLLVLDSLMHKAQELAREKNERFQTQNRKEPTRRRK